MENGRDDEKQQRHATRIEQQERRDEEPIGETVPSGHGSEPAPTRKAAEREHIRHQLEHEVGRHAAGEDGRLRDERSDDATREKLDAAAEEADRRVDAGPDDDEPRR